MRKDKQATTYLDQPNHLLPKNMAPAMKAGFLLHGLHKFYGKSVRDTQAKKGKEPLAGGLTFSAGGWSMIDPHNKMTDVEKPEFCFCFEGFKWAAFFIYGIMYHAVLPTWIIPIFATLVFQNPPVIPCVELKLSFFWWGLIYTDPQKVWVEGRLISSIFWVSSLPFNHHLTPFPIDVQQGKALWRLCASGVWTLLTRCRWLGKSLGSSLKNPNSPFKLGVCF